PALRERLEDLAVLVPRIAEDLGGSPQDEALVCSSPFLEELSRYSWPGNIRELRNYLERCIVLREQAPHLLLGQVAESTGEPERTTAVALDQPFRRARELWNREFERRYLEGVLHQHDGNVAAAARASGLGRTYFYQLLWRNGLK